MNKSDESLLKNPYLHNGSNTVLKKSHFNSNKLVYIESYGCQMNFSDSEIIASILSSQGYKTVNSPDNANLILINTCSIRDKAEQTIRKRLEKFNSIKKINSKIKVGVLGCMAERLKDKLLEEEKIVDMVVGPDSYKDIPNLLKEINKGRNAINVILSKDETYGDISPMRIDSNGVTALVSITRGCDNMCSFCVVPFTRGRERSRDPKSILNEIQKLYKNGYKEITLLGQNVDSYLWFGGGLKKDFKTAPPLNKKTAINFSNLLEIVAISFPKIRIRFSTSNPQDMTLDVINTMAKHPNVCNSIHLPFQSGSDKILKKMNRMHSRDEYLDLIDKIREIIPDCGISQDIISGFPTENQTDHNQTLSLMDYVKFDYGFMFSYSERPGTLAERKMKDDVPENIKKERLQEIINKQLEHSFFRTKKYIGKTVCVLIEKSSKKSNNFWSGRTSQNTVVVFPKKDFKKGQFIDVEITNCTSATLIGNGINISNSI